jgi:hypothetical protein
VNTTSPEPGDGVKEAVVPRSIAIGTAKPPL